MATDNASSQPPFRAAIFDFDGVLADTVDLHYTSFRRLFADEGVDFSFADYMRVANGAPRHRVIRAVLGDNLLASKLEALMDRKEEIIFDLAASVGLRPIDGALDLVHTLRDSGLRLGVASSSRTARAFLGIMKIDQLFEAITDACDAARPKPDPDVFLATARHLGVDPHTCVVFEDAKVGIEAAKAAGMRVVAITTTSAATELADADWVVDTFVGFDLRRIVEGDWPQRGRNEKKSHGLNAD